MIPMKAVTDGAFGKRLQERISKWAEMRNAAARVRISDKLFWWKFQEYGTARYTLKPDPLGLLPGEAAIWRRYQAALVFEHNGNNLVLTKVNEHPGIPARHPVENSIPVIREDARAKFEQLVKQGLIDNPALLKDFVRDAADQAKTRITDSYELHLSNTPREAGRLKGQTAAQAFAEDAQIVEVTE